MNTPLRALLAFALSMSPALAEEGELPEAADPDIVVIRSPVTEVDFEGVDINASVERPGMALVAEAHRPSFNPMIRIRTEWEDHFVFEDGW